VLSAIAVDDPNRAIARPTTDIARLNAFTIFTVIPF
jgi:hypothetical protein